ncbi:MAG: hypothetical protein LIO46_04230 [Clostridiales bacterium]|nr:hypothetical protein [Clostridiales bacterium]
MYQCDGCGYLFEDPVCLPVWEGAMRADALQVCPSCRREEFTAVFRCECCGSWQDDALQHSELEEYCTACVEQALAEGLRLLCNQCDAAQREIYRYYLQS